MLLLAEAELITIIVSEQAVAETERVLARKVPRVLPYYREVVRSTGMRIVRDPSPEEVETHKDIIAHQVDVPIVVAAMKAGSDYVVTHNRRHFLDDPGVATRSGLRIGTPADALRWVREQLARENERLYPPTSPLPAA